MEIHLLAFAGAKVFVQVFQVSAPLLWPLNLWLPLARHLTQVCVVSRDALASSVAWLLRRGSRRSEDDEDHRHAMLDVAY